MSWPRGSLLVWLGSLLPSGSAGGAWLHSHDPSAAKHDAVESRFEPPAVAGGDLPGMVGLGARLRRACCQQEDVRGPGGLRADGLMARIFEGWVGFG